MRRRGLVGTTGAALLGLLLGCRTTTQAPEPGALLLQVDLAAGAAEPDELRLWAYDDTGVLWSNARLPAEGPLAPQSASSLGTILLEPGTTVGDLRIDLRGLRGGSPLDEALLRLSPADLAAARFDVALSAALPPDSDGDGVPDPIDDCPAAPDPGQTGCSADAGAADGAAAGRDASSDAPAPPLPQGAACQAAAQCRSGFCKDGACCDSACTGACNSCATGTCTPVTSGDDAPECAAPMSCNKKGKCVGN